MNQYIRTSLGVAVIIIMTSTIGFFSWNYYQNNLADEIVVVQPPVKSAPKQFCTQEAKLCPDGVNYVGRTEKNCEFAECPETVGIADKLVVISPAPDETISSPVTLTGRAVGGWFFEASFPAEVYDGNDKLLGSAPVQFVPQNEQDTWMTENFVDFKGELKFTQPKTETGYILFKKDNPSGNPELDESFKLPVKFENLANNFIWKTYINEKYGFKFEHPGSFIFKTENTVVEETYMVGYFENRNGGTIGLRIKNNKLDPNNIYGLYGKVELSDLEKIKVDGVTAYAYIIGDAGCGGHFVSIPSGEKTIEMNFVDCDGSRSAESNRSKILSTFKFTN
jgi:hypothetical protein